MKIYDKISWHTDAGEKLSSCIHRFQVIFNYLSIHEMLSPDGKEIFEMGIDSATSLNTKLLTEKGCEFCDKHEEMLVGMEPKTLEVLLNATDYDEYSEYIQDIVAYILGYGEQYSAAVVEEIYNLKDKISNQIRLLPQAEEARRNILFALIVILNEDPIISKKMGR